MNYNAKKRVFWHESGHFSAQYFNKQYFGKFGIKGVYITRVNHNGKTEYTGGCIPISPPGYTGREPIKHPASVIASTTYGCIFQSVFLSSKFEECFAEEAPGVNGFDDFEKVNKIMERFSLSNDEISECRKCIKEQVEIVKASNQLSKLFEIQIDDLIISEELKFEIDIIKLENRLTPFLIAHKDIYKNYVLKLERFFDNHVDRNS